MATMYSLFFGILFIAVCDTISAEHCFIGARLYACPHPAQTQRPTPTNSNNHRHTIISIAQDEIGVQEATGNNDGIRVEEYLRYTDLGKGYEWCAAFISWCYGQAGLPEPRNPWSPALFPKVKTYCRGDACLHSNAIKGIKPADIFGIYGRNVQRINHVGLVKATQGSYITTIEGNSNNRVESKRRSISTLYVLADWVSDDRN